MSKIKDYLRFKNMNVSNARRNVPKDIKSLKSNFISTTPILCRMKVKPPCTRLFHNSIVAHQHTPHKRTKKKSLSALFLLYFHNNRQNHRTSLCLLPNIIFQRILNDTLDIIPACNILFLAFQQRIQHAGARLIHQIFCLADIYKPSGNNIGAGNNRPHFSVHGNHNHHQSIL